MQVEADPGVLQHEVVQLRCQKTLAEGGGTGHSERARGCRLKTGQLLFSGHKPLQKITAVLEVMLPRFAEPKLARGPIHQRRAQLRFQPRDQTADVRRRYLQLLRRCRKTALLHHFHKGFDRFPVSHPVLLGYRSLYARIIAAEQKYFSIAVIISERARVYT